MQNLSLFRSRIARRLLPAVLGALGLAFFSQPTRGAVSQDAPPLVLKTARMSVRIQPKNAWTINLVQWEEKTIVPEKGFQGLVIDLDNGKFVGSGHTEGGREEVLSISLSADGKAVEATNGGVVEGKDIVLTKTAKLAGAHLESIIRVREDSLEQRHHLKIEEDFSIGKAYAFMFPWSTQTDGWMALTTQGETLEGGFGEAKWELTKDVQWAAIYDPSIQVAMLTQFDSQSQAGAGVRHGYWNQPVYHKQYYQPLARRALKAGEEFSYAATLRPISATPAEWKEKVRATAEQHPVK